jgi:hypothetical protein
MGAVRLLPFATSITSWVGAVCLLNGFAFSVYVSKHALSTFEVVKLFPAVVFLSFLMVRLAKGFKPKTFNAKLRSTDAKFNWMRKGNSTRFQLIMMPINHYGEKCRWIFDMIQAPYEEITVGGLLSIGLRGRSVPWLVDQQSNSIIGNSDEILSYVGALVVPALEEIAANDDGDESEEQRKQLNDRISKTKLLFQRTPETLEWEKELNVFGHAIQGWAYYYHLRSGSFMGMLAWGAYEVEHVSLIERWLVYCLFPFSRLMVGQTFNLLSEKERDERYELIRNMLDKVDTILESNRKKYSLKNGEDVFLTGKHISYVDITFCSLAAPLLSFAIVLRPPGTESYYAAGRFKSFILTNNKESKYGAPLDTETYVKNHTPKETAELEKELLDRPSGQYIVRMYEKYRKAKF